MMLGIDREVAVLCTALLDGSIVVLSYWAIRILRRLIRHSSLWISIEDLLFWVFTGLYLFAEIYRVCLGMIRWYFVLGVCCGGVIICIIMQKLEKKYVDKLRKKR